MAKRNSIPSSKQLSKSSDKLKRKLVRDETADPETRPKKNSVKKGNTEPKNSDINVGNGVDKQQKSCHQCHRWNNVVECKKCRSKRFCVSCIATWYPNASEEDFVEACPVCRNSCNCKACLREFSPKFMQDMLRYSCSEPDKIQHSKHILEKVLPLVRRLNREQQMEKEIEAKTKGLSLSRIELQDAQCAVDDDIICDHCGTYCFDFYRSCSLCAYDLCLVCCRDLRDGHLHGGNGWKSCEDGSIPCAPEDIGGCGERILDLRRIMAVDWVANVFKKAQRINKINTSDDISQIDMKSCACDDSGNEALQEKSSASVLYHPSSKDIQPLDMQHFQWHWSKGEPIIVSDVLSTSSELSWEPMVLWRAFRDIKKTNKSSRANDVNAVNCLDWSEVTIDLYQFFRRYLLNGWSQSLKLEDWTPSCLSQEQFSRHFLEFISCLPFKDYTHPYNGKLNIAVKLPDLSLKPDLGPRMDIAYADSVTKLHYDKSDTVNLLAHMNPAAVTSKKLEKTPMSKQKHGDQDQAIVCEEGLKTNEDQHRVIDPMKGCVCWDIFRRQDVPKLEEYLRNHSAKFRPSGRLPVKQVVHPIHDRAFYLNMKHKRKLKKEFGIEPWTFKQKLGEAVFVPAGCPYQVRNIKSSMNVKLNFFSPESLGECIRLQQEFRMLPYNHMAKQGKLNIEKMTLYALNNAVADLAGVIDMNEPTDDLQLAEVPESSTDNDTIANIPCNNTNGWLYDTESDNDNDHPTLSPSTLDGLPVIELSGTSPATATSETNGLWRGHSVGAAAKSLLEAIECRYPNTFQSVQTRSNAIWLPILKEFHIIIKRFFETTVAGLTKEQLTTIQEDLNEFERFGFDLSWTHERLKMVERVKFGDNTWRHELTALEEGLIERRKEFWEARETLEEARVEYDKAKDARNKKACEVEKMFGADYYRVLNGQLGFGMLPRY